MYIDVPDPQSFVFAQAVQSIGLGLAAPSPDPTGFALAALGDGAR